MSYTPGPWEVDENDHSSIWEKNTYEIDETTNLICNVYPIDEGSSGHQQDNARLIAAAPDLLAALESAIDHVECSGMRHVMAEAIAKAIGTL